MFGSHTPRSLGAPRPWLSGALNPPQGQSAARRAPYYRPSRRFRHAAASPETTDASAPAVLDKPIQHQQSLGGPSSSYRPPGGIPMDAVPANLARPLEGNLLDQGGNQLLPKLLLLGAAFLWGSYAPAVRLVYAAPDAPDAVVVMAARAVLQALAAAAVVSLQPAQQQPVPSTPASPLQQWLGPWAPPTLVLAATELGLWNFLATSLQTLGLQLTGATRASFLIQATLVLTPLLSTLAGQRPGGRVLGGCALALAGTLLITADEAGGAAGGISGLEAAGLGGDAAILLAALFYSLGVVRVGGYARQLPTTELAAGKSLVIGALGLGSLLYVAASLAQQGGDPLALWPGWDSSPVSWAALLWSGVGPGALASYLHVQGQKSVPPAQAQVIFSSKPLWAAALAWVLLGGEELGPLTWVGGATLAAAGLIASTGPPEQQQQQVAMQRGAQQPLTALPTQQQEQEEEVEGAQRLQPVEVQQGGSRWPWDSFLRR